MWEGIPPMFEWVAWIKVLGDPISLWDRHISNKIGERCGRILVKSVALSDDGNMAEERMAILVHSGKRFSKELILKWKDQNINVWVEDISSQWCPAFLGSNSPEEDEVSSEFVIDSSEMDSPARSPEVEKSKDCWGDHLTGRLEGSPLKCMENQQTPRSPHAHVADTPRDQVLEADCLLG
ncbi:hypothetical protein Hanom_Chr04g00346001 [Helianthus anomalus]